MSSKLAGQVAIVTGGGTGIGLAMAEELAKHGALPVITGRTQKSLDEAVEQMKSKGLTGVAMVGDMANEENVKEIVGQILLEHKRIDILVNNAGVDGGAGNLEDQTADEFDRLFSINVKSQFLMCKAVIPHMKGRNEELMAKLQADGHDTFKGRADQRVHAGAIINLSSIAGNKGFASLSLYASTQFARLGLMRSLALELAGHNITVNCVNPGIVWTPMWDRIAATFGGSDEADKKQETFEANINQLIPMKRPQWTTEIADAVIYLVSQPNITGQDITIDGGYSA